MSYNTHEKQMIKMAIADLNIAEQEMKTAKQTENTLTNFCKFSKDGKDLMDKIFMTGAIRADSNLAGQYAKEGKKLLHAVETIENKKK